VNAASESRPLVIACGALASELRAVLATQGLEDAVEIVYLPANLHNRPETIVERIDATLVAALGDTSDGRALNTERPVLIGYADCGTGGALDRFLATRPALRRLPGAHCYELFAGSGTFAALAEEEPGTFYLTDFLARHFDALVWQGLGLDRHPELRDDYFGNYRRVVLLSQSADPTVVAAGRAAAGRLGLAFAHRHVGRSGLARAVELTLSPRVRGVA
jgi:Protein of unknown function (DUF1638)